MPNQSPGHPDTPLDSLTGVVERITFQSEESGYTVAMVQVEGRYDPVAVVGSFPAPQVGETLRAEGQWVSHPKYGRQFQLSRYETVAPTTLAGVRRYLGAGLIRGIGPKMAERIVDHFGPDTLAVIEKDPEKLRAVPGVGDKRLAVIQAAWKEQQHARQTLLFLQSHGIGTAYALKIHDHYKERAIDAVKENPYRLASEITGIGFATADQIADKLGFKSDHPLRAESGILFVLGHLADKGHVYFPRPALIAKCAEILEMPAAIVGEALTQLALSRKVAIEPLETAAPPASEALPEAVFLSNLHQCEQHVAKKLAALTKHPSPGGAADVDRLVEWAQQRSALSLAPAQIDAVGSAFKHNVVVITGGPGTGKTTIINTIIAICRQLQLKTSLAAPTGRAAKRMQEATGHDAKTLHRLLEFRFHQGGFQRNAQRPLGSQMVIVDEASMIDTALMHHLLQAVPPGAALILVGDINQLPSVGPGNVLADIIASHSFAVVHLTEIFRQSRESRIVVNAHRICRGDMPEIAPSSQRTDFYFRDRETPEATLEFIVALVSDHIPRLFGFHSKRDIQVLAPMHRGLAGAKNLNDVLQGVLNRSETQLERGGRLLKTGDKVMQIRNNYDKEVFNGDLGTIVKFDAVMQEATINFDGRPVVYEYTQLEEIVLAYAISVHKSQGSEYPVVVMPLLTQHYMLLQRNLLYTAVTRGQKLVVLVGSRKALAMAVKNNKVRQRYSLLQRRLERLLN